MESLIHTPHSPIFSLMTMTLLCDAHCHLQDERLDLERVLARAAQAGVRRFVCCGCEEADWPAVRDLAGRYANVLPSFGLHPWYVTRASADWQRTLETLLRSVVSGVGEIGLDHTIRERCDDAQEAAFLAQLRLARTLERPVSVHCRKAWGRLLELLRSEGGVRHGGVIHSYSGPPELVPELEALGFWISFSGTLTRSNATLRSGDPSSVATLRSGEAPSLRSTRAVSLRRVEAPSLRSTSNRRGHASLKAVSPDRLLLETDAPDLPPVHAASPVNEPANLVAVLEAAARLLQESPETLAARVWNNFHRCFQLFPKSSFSGSPRAASRR